MLKRNIAANFLGKGITFAITFAILPIQLNLLGAEGFGLLGFFTSLLAILSFSDFGITATFNREVSKFNARGNATDEIHDLFRAYEFLYGGILSIVTLTIYLLSSKIASQWLNTSDVNAAAIANAVALLGVACAVQLISGLYNGGLMGLENQVKANQLQILLIIYRGAGSVIILLFVSPTIEAYFYWYIATTIMHCILSRQIFLKTISYKSSNIKWNMKWSHISQNWRYSASMCAMAIISTLLTQIDKLTISKQLPIESLGIYTLALTLATLPLMLSSPIGLAAYPRIIALLESQDKPGLIKTYHLITKIASIFVIPTGVIICVFPFEILYMWTGSRETASMLTSVTSLLAIGQILQGLTLIPYYVALANGNVSLNIKIGTISIFMMIPLSIFLVSKYGINGGGLAWLIMNACTFPIYMHILHKNFLNGEIIKWAKNAIGIPTIISLFCVAALYTTINSENERLLMFLNIAALWCVITGINLLIHKELRIKILNGTKQYFRS